MEIFIDNSQNAPQCPYLFISVKSLFVQSNNGGVELYMFHCTVSGDEMYCECFPPSCLSWNIFNPNKPVFTQDAARGCHSFPDTLLKVRLNSPLINKLICKVSPEVYHSFDGCATCPVWYGRVGKCKYLQQLPG